MGKIHTTIKIQRGNHMGFAEWLHNVPQWKQSLDRCHPNVFEDLKMTQEEVEKILEKLDEHGVFGKPSRNYY